MIIYKTRREYWSSSKFADWLSTKLGIVKPQDSWNALFYNEKTPHLVEDTMDKIQNVVMFPLDVIDSLGVYFRNRFITKTHIINTNLEPGLWHEVDDRLLHGMMEALVEFIEIDKALMQDWSTTATDKRWLVKYNPFRKHERYPDKGKAYLDWEMTLTDEDTGLPSKQAASAMEQWTIYNWWKNIRPQRQEILDVTGYMEFRQTEDKDNQAKLGQILDEIAKLENDRDAEDQDMMIRLVKIRQHLWT